jgi:hypothetical protein
LTNILKVQTGCGWLITIGQEIKRRRAACVVLLLNLAGLWRRLRLKLNSSRSKRVGFYNV